MGVEKLAEIISEGFVGGATRDSRTEPTKAAIAELFGSRYAQKSRHAERAVFTGDNVAFAGLLHEQSPPSGAYGGMSLVWFPTESTDDAPSGSLLTFVCGTRGLAPDEQILGRPGHVRQLQALRRHLGSRFGVSVWVKPDPTNLSQPVPDIVRREHSRFHDVFEKYGPFIYAAVQVPHDQNARAGVIQAFLDFYAIERGWKPLKPAEDEINELQNSLRSQVFVRVDEKTVHDLLKERRFVILQGPPGTGKTRLADALLRDRFNGKGRTVQFHPAVTYETFISGIAPDVTNETLRFAARLGWLPEAAVAAKSGDYLLVVDEINRGDLGRVLGEAIYLFEPREIAEGKGRTVRLPNPVDGMDSLSIPKELYVIGTMNTADRSIAQLDLAVRRRFAFVDIWPDADVVVRQNLKLATLAFGRLQDIFVQYAPDDALTLLPGHAYFLANDDAQLRRRLRYELLPLLRDYVREGRLGSCEIELRAYIDWLDSEISSDGSSS